MAKSSEGPATAGPFPFSGSVHCVLPDTQVKPGVPTDHLRWIGQYLVDQFAGRPDVKVIHLGDHWDLPSLSSYDRGKGAMEGRRVLADIKAGNDAFTLLNEPLEAYNAQRRARKERRWSPQRYLLRGNHENRINRAVENDPQLDGILSTEMLKSPGWEVVPFLEPLWLDGVAYAHYFYNPMSGRPYGGACSLRLKTIGTTFIQGHQQVLDYAIRFVNGKSQHGLIAGTCYLHNEDYLGPQGNNYWRGIIILHEVRGGSFDPMFVSLDFLCRKYEGMALEEFLCSAR